MTFICGTEHQMNQKMHLCGKKKFNLCGKKIQPHENFEWVFFFKSDLDSRIQNNKKNPI